MMTSSDGLGRDLLEYMKTDLTDAGNVEVHALSVDDHRGI